MNRQQIADKLNKEIAEFNRIIKGENKLTRTDGIIAACRYLQSKGKL